MGCRDMLSFYQRCSACFRRRNFAGTRWVYRCHVAADSWGCRKIFWRGRNCRMVSWGQDAADGSDGNDSSHTSQAFRRRKSADADGPGGKRRSFFSLWKQLYGKTERILYLLWKKSADAKLYDRKKSGIICATGGRSTWWCCACIPADYSEETLGSSKRRRGQDIDVFLCGNSVPCFGCADSRSAVLPELFEW